MLHCRICSTKLNIPTGESDAQEPGPDLIGVLVSNGGFATAVHARQLHTAAAIAVHLLKVSNPCYMIFGQ